MTVSTKMNARQYLQLGEDPPGVRLELEHGEIAVSPSPSVDHGFTDRRLSQIISNHIDEYDLGTLVGDIDIILDDFNVRRPDIIFIAKSRLNLLTNDLHGLHFPPDLCVEILSPGSATVDQTDKFDLYAKCGIPHYWLVDPFNHTFNAFKLTRKRYVKTATGAQNDTVSAPPFPKLQIPLTRLWLPRSKK